MNWYLGNNWYLLLLLLLPLLSFFLIRFLRWKKKKRELFADPKFHEVLFDKNSKFLKVFPALYFLATLFLIFSIIDLLSGSEKIETNQKMNNVIFMMDVSSSMNAEDINPDRLTQAKNLIINTIHELKNDKIGIVIFAGEAVSVMPLTTDYGSVETYISDLQTTDITIQGTDFLQAMETAVGKFKNINKGARKVVLISDGEDNEGNDNATDDIDSKLEELQQQLLIQAKSKNDYEDVADEIYRLRELKQNALVENAEREGKRQRIAEMTDFLNKQSAELEEYDEQLVRRLIEKVTIYEDKLTVEFKSGIEIDEEI